MNETLLEMVAHAWSFRWRVEREATLRFARLARRMEEVGCPESLVSLARRASEDEKRHAAHCENIASEYGAKLSADAVELVEITPPGLSPREKVLYEVVAACCVTETESTGVLTSLLAREILPSLRPILRELAKDEVVHSQLGWAYLSWEAGQRDVSFLSAWLIPMLEGLAGPDLFVSGDFPQETSELLRHGVLPRKEKRVVFAQSLREVVFPGLRTFGVASHLGEAWLDQQLAAVSESSQPQEG